MSVGYGGNFLEYIHKKSVPSFRFTGQARIVLTFYVIWVSVAYLLLHRTVIKVRCENMGVCKVRKIFIYLL